MYLPIKKPVSATMRPALYFLFIFALCCGFSVAVLQKPSHASNNRHDRVCSQTAVSLYAACLADRADNYYTGKAACLNLTGYNQRRECYRSIRQDKWQERRQCRSVHIARHNLCADLGQQAYDPDFGEDYAANFVDPRRIGNDIVPNPFLPLVEGNQWVYQITTEDDEGDTITETIRVEVTGDTKQIEGITCVVVKDVVDENDQIIEDTDDWFAQDIDGNVWYCGEIAMNYESFEDDDPLAIELTDIDGSWKSGRDFAKAGILFPAIPEVGEVIRQEVAWREAEDVIEVLSVTGSESTPGGSCQNNCLVTRDFTPLDPGVNETKYFAPGVGLILEIDADGNRVELLSFTPAL